MSQTWWLLFCVYFPAFFWTHRNSLKFFNAIQYSYCKWCGVTKHQGWNQQTCWEYRSWTSLNHKTMDSKFNTSKKSVMMDKHWAQLSVLWIPQVQVGRPLRSKTTPRFAWGPLRGKGTSEIYICHYYPLLHYMPLHPNASYCICHENQCKIYVHTLFEHNCARSLWSGAFVWYCMTGPSGGTLWRITHLSLTRFAFCTILDKLI